MCYGNSQKICNNYGHLPFPGDAPKQQHDIEILMIAVSHVSFDCYVWQTDL